MAKKKTGTAVTIWEKELADLAQETTKGLKASEGNKFVSFKSGQLSFGGEEIPANEMDVIVVGWTNHNAYYDPKKRFDPSNPSSPICYSFGQDPDEMVPHDEAPKPQNDACAGCPFNEWESGEGKAKACKNTFRLAIIAASDLERLLDGEKVELAYASIPPMSLKYWSSYAKKTLQKLKRPHWSVITRLKLESDSQSQFRVVFELIENIDGDKELTALKALWQEAQEGIGFPYVEREAANEQPAKGKKPSKFARK